MTVSAASCFAIFTMAGGNDHISTINERSYDLLYLIMRRTAQLGVPLVVLAWGSVLAASVVMIFVLKRYDLRKYLVRALVVGVISLAAHMIDYFGTLHVCPDLSFEANPIWCVVVETMGLTLARWYGLTGKVLLSVLGFELFAYYLVQRVALLPAEAKNLVDFWARFGQPSESSRWIRWARIRNFFAFLFGLIGPFCFYIALLNSITDPERYMSLPSMPFMLMMYLLVLTALYVFGNYWWFKRRP